MKWKHAIERKMGETKQRGLSREVVESLLVCACGCQVDTAGDNLCRWLRLIEE